MAYDGPKDHTNLYSFCAPKINVVWRSIDAEGHESRPGAFCTDRTRHVSLRHVVKGNVAPQSDRMFFSAQLKVT